MSEPLDDRTTPEIQAHFKKLRAEMLRQIDDHINIKIEQFKKDIINIVDQETKEWSKPIYDRAWSKGKHAL